MTTDMNKDDILAFCRACAWAHETWSLHRGFQDELPVDGRLIHRHGYFLSRLSVITQEYVLLQISKLHDPALQLGNVNISIDFVIERGSWDAETGAALKEMRSTLGNLHEYLGRVRRKVLAHNDRPTLVGGEDLGAFPHGMDDKYFETLQAFVDLAHDKVVGGPYPFDNFAKIDTELFVNDLVRTYEAPNPPPQPTSGSAGKVGFARPEFAARGTSRS